jgi:hypothetical protein
LLETPFVHTPNEGFKRILGMFETDADPKDLENISNIYSVELQRQAEGRPWALLFGCEYVVRIAIRFEETGPFNPDDFIFRCMRGKYSTGRVQCTRMKLSLNGPENRLVWIMDIKNTWIGLLESQTAKLWLIVLSRFVWNYDFPLWSYARSSSIVIVLLMQWDKDGYCSRLGIGDFDEDA